MVSHPHQGGVGMQTRTVTPVSVDSRRWRRDAANRDRKKRRAETPSRDDRAQRTTRSASSDWHETCSVVTDHDDKGRRLQSGGDASPSRTTTAVQERDAAASCLEAQATQSRQTWGSQRDGKIRGLSRNAHAQIDATEPQSRAPGQSPRTQAAAENQLFGGPSGARRCEVQNRERKGAARRLATGDGTLAAGDLAPLRASRFTRAMLALTGKSRWSRSSPRCSSPD